jgi:hypothetical protein
VIGALVELVLDNPRLAFALDGFEQDKLAVRFSAGDDSGDRNSAVRYCGGPGHG